MLALLLQQDRSWDFSPGSDDFLILQLILQAVFFVVFGTICAILAPGRGRSAVGWFFIGGLFSCMGLIVLLLIPNLKVEQEKQRRRDAETRRLREQLKKERQVADERHEAHSHRLGAHDRALGVDTTRRTEALTDSPADSLADSLADSPPPPLAGAADWYYAIDGQQQGPIPGAELRALWLDEKVPDRALVWREGFAEWTPIGDVGDLLGEA